MNQSGGGGGKRKDTLKVSITERDLIKICYLYYRDEKTQEEIASLFGISRFRVLRLLREARAKGLVTIEIHDPQEELTSLEVELAKAFGLKESVVIRVDDFSDRSPLEQLGEAGARYLVRVLDRCKVLGVAWGQTLFHMVNAVRPMARRDLTVVQISGGLGSGGREGGGGPDTSLLTMMLSRQLGGRDHIIQAPVIVGDRRIRDKLLLERGIRETLVIARTADTAILGIGACSQSGGLWKVGLLDEKDYLQLKKAGAVGALCGRFYNVGGESCGTPLDDRIIGLTLDEVRKIKNKIGVAMGAEKREAILGAFRGGLLDVLVTDEAMAKGLLAGRGRFPGRRSQADVAGNKEEESHGNPGKNEGGRADGTKPPGGGGGGDSAARPG
jgi:deoxyribonucleoside regulator